MRGVAALLTMRVERPHPEGHRETMRRRIGRVSDSIFKQPWPIVFPRHCERKRSNPSRRAKRMDCFVALAPRNDGKSRHTCAFPRRSRARVVQKIMCAKRTEGAGNGFNGFLRALPGDRAFLPPSLAELPPPT